MIPGQEEWTLIFSKNADAWGSFFYDEADDALRVTVKPHKHDYREYLTYEFPLRRPAEATAELQWEELAVPWTVKVEDPDEIYMARLRRELTTVPGFTYQGYVAAARYTRNGGQASRPGAEVGGRRHQHAVHRAGKFRDAGREGADPGQNGTRRTKRKR